MHIQWHILAYINIIVNNLVNNFVTSHTESCLQQLVQVFVFPPASFFHWRLEYCRLHSSYHKEYSSPRLTLPCHGIQFWSLGRRLTTSTSVTVFLRRLTWWGTEVESESMEMLLKEWTRKTSLSYINAWSAQSHHQKQEVYKGLWRGLGSTKYCLYGGVESWLMHVM